MVEQVSSSSQQKNKVWIMLVGILLQLVAIFLIFWNEGIGLRGVKTAQINGYEIVPISNSPADFNNNNKLIYTTGLMTSNSILQDPLLGFSEKAIKIERRVEMFQWTQSEDSKKEKLSDGSEREIVTYLYRPVWSKDLIDSNAFKDAVGHRNPVSMPVNSLQGQAQDITVGDFHLSPELVALISGDVAVDLSHVDVTNLQKGLKQPVQHDGNFIFIGADPKAPVIGDVRISIHKVVPQEVSVIAQQTDNILHPLNIKGEKPIAMLVKGQVTLNDMLNQGKKESKGIKWGIYIGTLILMLIGSGMVLAPLRTSSVESLSVFGRFLALGTVLVSFIIGFGLWSVMMLIAWLIVKPSWAMTLAIIIVIVYGILYAVLRKRNKPEV